MDIGSPTIKTTTKREKKTLRVPIGELIKSIPGMFGIRLEEQPAYDVVARYPGVEIRRYQPLVMAQVEVDGAHEDALNRGFEILASYIFGDNVGGSQISMTAPVINENPTQMVIEESAPRENQKAVWKVSFVLPAKIDAATAPTPLDSRIRIKKMPARVMAAVRFSGRNDDATRATALAKLNAWLKESGVRPYPPVIWAQYDQPFSVPALRRNEVMIEVDTPSFS